MKEARLFFVVGDAVPRAPTSTLSVHSLPVHRLAQPQRWPMGLQPGSPMQKKNASLAEQAGACLGCANADKLILHLLLVSFS